jgi:8-oxo-dGTP pyrophosphatase MutT (NUDIX family)
MGIKDWVDFTDEVKIKKSAGIVIILNHEKILLCHGSRSKWVGSFGPPKGGVDIGESEIDAAIRELQEETSIMINKSQISNPDNPIIVDYTYKSGAKFKEVYLYVVYIDNISEIGLKSEIIPTKKLQVTEVDWCGFMDKREDKYRTFHRFIGLLDLLNN